MYTQNNKMNGGELIKMSKIIKNIHTNEGNAPIDYKSLANLPDIPVVIEQAGFMKKDDSSYVRTSTQSEAFNAEKEYSIGDYCIYENVLYKFTEAKSTGEWDSTKATATTIDAELNEQNLKLKRIEDQLPVYVTQNQYGELKESGQIDSDKYYAVIADED